MSKIKFVAACVDDSEGLPGIRLDIHLYNGQTLLLSLKSKQNDPAFQRLYRDGELTCPRTDGDSIYWRDGTRLSFPEIMGMVRGT